MGWKVGMGKCRKVCKRLRRENMSYSFDMSLEELEEKEEFDLFIKLEMVRREIIKELEG